jgi:MinD-like ATPase involved in chromosome partitioning or flagellar assembly
MSEDVTGNGSNQPPQRPMWQVQPGPVTGPFSPPTGEGQPGQRSQPPEQPGPQHLAPPPPQTYQDQPPYQEQGYPQQGYEQPYQPGAPQPAAPAHPSPAEAERAMSAQDFLAHRHRTIDIGPATWGWRGLVRRLTFGLIKPKMGRAERNYRESRAIVQRSFSGPRTIVFANPKGGAAKTTSVLAAGYTFGTIRGGGVVAWDNNETRGTLGIRGERANHQNTTRELLDDLQRFSDVYESRIGDLGAFVRSQGDAHFDVLASDERADVTGQIKASDFGAVHRLLERFYHLILVDTGNNLRAENWLAAAQTADLIVVTCTVREDTGYSGLWMLDALEDAGHHDLKEKTITVLADPSANVDAQLASDLTEVYEQRTRAVFRIPYDPALVAGSVIQYGQLSEQTTAAWLKACAAMAAAL